MLCFRCGDIEITKKNSKHGFPLCHNCSIGLDELVAEGGELPKLEVFTDLDALQPADSAHTKTKKVGRPRSNPADVNSKDSKKAKKSNFSLERTDSDKSGKVVTEVVPFDINPKSKSTENSCFVCDDGGALVVCDFASCPKVYHLACLQYNTSWPEDQKWYCPQHYCACCSARQSTSVAVTQCASCPTSFCNACFDELSDRDKNGDNTGMATRRGQFKCFHCTSPSPKIRLSKLLEKVWAKVGSQYSGGPFLSLISAREMQAEKKLLSTKFHKIIDPPLSLLEVLDRIRRLQYNCVEEFLVHMNLIVSCITHCFASCNIFGLTNFT